MRQLWMVLLAVLAVSTPARGQGTPTRESALELAFPGADEIVQRNVVLSREDADRVRSLAGSEPGSRLVTVYEGRRGGETAGWALLDTHVVRTSPETVLLVVDARGRIAATHLVAFHEPAQYRAPERWLRRLNGLGRDRVAVGRGVDAISGATMTSHAVTAAARRMLAVWQVAFGATTS